MKLDIDIAKYIGVRFKVHGRSLEEGFDCYGLQIALNKELGKELPDLEGYKRADDDDFNNNYVDILSQLDMKKVDDIQPTDELLFYSGNKAVHIGMALGNDLFIHCDRFGVRINKLSSYGRRYEVYRWQK